MFILIVKLVEGLILNKLVSVLFHYNVLLSENKVFIIRYLVPHVLGNSFRDYYVIWTRSFFTVTKVIKNRHVGN